MGYKYNDEEIAQILSTTPKHVHNTAKRGFNRIINIILKQNKCVTIIDIITLMMSEFQLDEREIKKILNQRNKALLSLELADSYKLLARGKMTQEEYDTLVEKAQRNVDDNE